MELSSTKTKTLLLIFPKNILYFGMELSSLKPKKQKQNKKHLKKLIFLKKKFSSHFGMTTD